VILFCCIDCIIVECAKYDKVFLEEKNIVEMASWEISIEHIQVVILPNAALDKLIKLEESQENPRTII